MKRGWPKKENNCNDVRRVCQENLKATYGNCVAKSCVNIFKPSARKKCKMGLTGLHDF